MSALPIQQPLSTDTDRTADNRLAVAAMLGYLPLPAATVTPRPDAVHVTVTSARELSQWVYALGGRHRRTAAADGVVLWTLHTQTPERPGGSIVQIRVHAAVVEGEDVLAELRPGVTG